MRRRRRSNVVVISGLSISSISELGNQVKP
jgi:hypothetical protein